MISTPSTNPTSDTGSADPVFEASRDRLRIVFALTATFLVALVGLSLFSLHDGNGTSAAYTFGLVLFLTVFVVTHYQRAAVRVRLGPDEIEARTLFGKTFSVAYEDVAEVIVKSTIRLIGWNRRPVLHFTRGFEKPDELSALISAKLDVNLTDA